MCVGRVLFTLSFQLAVPTPFRFLHYLLQLSPLPPHPLEALSVRRMAEALLELTLLETPFLRHPPSHVASTAVYLALGLVRYHDGLAGVVVLSGASPVALGGLVKDLSTVLDHEANQPQPCALLSRYKSWEELHGRQAREVAAATAAAAAPRMVAPPPWPASYTAPSAGHAGAASSTCPLERCIINLSAMSSLSLTTKAECC
ncbi:hypothetical protein TSOC_003120 [Tetrabaena socialis]|uniref:Cyclin C-terminal domain-containing protein n=1 Tax=Tetrabaena socialis TaxID=47790 RepID=A0A2J8ACF4_9CHLO|nr:hypothetical protein TSOC_003120 [Tetrabaena socialis]|eukprot:PNH10187.1 hypothetical protein TSOC_003120 [Tetrabaena socialis]